MAGTAISIKETPSKEECWELIARIVASNHLRRASRLQELLQYLAKRTLLDQCESVHEQTVGVDVFGRREGYDTSIDNIVRTSVSDLRKRIDTYFTGEGATEAIIMEIPRWNYVPVFKVRPIAPPPPQPVVAEASVQPLIEYLAQAPAATQPSNWTRIALAMTAGLALLLVVVSMYWWMQYRNLHRALYHWQYEPSVSQLWTEILSSAPDTDVVIADASFGLLQDLSKKTFSLDDYLNHNYINELQEQNPSLGRIVRWNLGSQDEFKLAHRIMALDPLDKRIHLYGARDYMPDLTNRDNVVLIGGRISNPWDALFEDRMNFSVKFDNDGSISVINRSPIAGEQPIYTHSNAFQYCVIGYLPNPEHRGVVLLIEGTGAEATEAAGNFLLSEDQLAGLKKTLHVDRLPYFEALLRVSSVQGTPLAATVQAYRVYPNLH